MCKDVHTRYLVASELTFGNSTCKFVHIFKRDGIQSPLSCTKTLYFETLCTHTTLVRAYAGLVSHTIGTLVDVCVYVLCRRDYVTCAKLSSSELGGVATVGQWRSS